MKVKCIILSVDKFDPDHTGLILQPILEDCPPFPFSIHKPIFQYEVGQFLDIEVTDIVRLYVDFIEMTTESKQKEALK